MFLDKALDEIGRKNKIVIGLDLTNDYVQISYCRLDQSMPDTVSLVMGEEQYNIPAVLCRKHQQEGQEEFWVIGKDALQTAKDGKGDLVEDLLLLVRNNTSAQVGDKEYTPRELMEIFFKKLLGFTAAYTGGMELAAIAMTLKSIEPDTCNLLREAGSSAAGSQCEIFFMSHQDCFFQYILHQPEEMWTQNVLLYDYRKAGIHSYELQMNRNSRPVVCLIEEENFPQMKMTDVSQMSDAQKQAFFTQLDNAFLEIVRNHCEGKFVSSAFLLGDHFTRDWCKDSLRYLCKGRRVFQGNNLFSKGACYGAREKVLPSTLSTTYVYLSDECLHANIGMNCNRGKEETYQPLLNAGTNWYDARRSIDLILAKDNTLELTITPVDGGQAKIARITLEGLHVRGNKTNRIGLSICMKNAETAEIEIADKGFGEFYPSSGRTWKESFVL